MSAPSHTPAPDMEEAGTPLPPSPPSASIEFETNAGQQMEPSRPDEHKGKKRLRTVSLEPSTPKPEDADLDPLGSSVFHLKPIRDDEKGEGDHSPPPSGSPTMSAAIVASSPRHESGLRNMDRGVRKLNVRERESSSRTRRRRMDSKDSKECDNRSSDEDEDMDVKPSASLINIKPSSVSDTRASAPPSPKTRAKTSSPPPKKRRSFDVSPMDGPSVTDADAPPHPDSPLVAAADVDIEIDSEAPHEAPVTPPASGSGSDLTAAAHEPAEVAPMDVTVTIVPPEPLAPPAVIESHKRPRSEEPEPIGRPRSPPPPVPTTIAPVAKPPTTPFSGGFAAFASNPMKVKAAEQPLWAGSSIPLHLGFASLVTQSPRSIFASPSPSLPARFTSTFSYASNGASPVSFGTPQSPVPARRPDMQPMNVRSVPGGGFGAFSGSSGFSRYGPQRPTSPTSKSSSLERPLTAPKENGSTATTSNSSGEDDSDKEAEVSFADRLKTESGPADADDDDDEKVSVNKQDLTTGEENEKTVYQQRAKLFAMEPGAGWKERGSGLLKINIQKDDKSSARLIMRSDAVFRHAYHDFGGAPTEGQVPFYTLRVSYHQIPNVKASNDVRDKILEHLPSSKSSSTPPIDADNVV
ncbi:hypothetical protein BKA62DRAFT_688250 [Auriculariales sp. MPI-PUGE-AT-0066]|nr:hypothetical protein BKA62DRAFT_688250 [Auriculariales sp. MPI-PUGE-AT-0066]